MLRQLSRTQAWSIYKGALESRNSDALRRLCREDLFFLLVVGCKRKDADRDWIYDKCRIVEAAPNGYMDLWFREGYKSTIHDCLIIQDILNDPNETIAIFSHTRPIAKAFLAQIKREFEINNFLKSLFPDVLYSDPQKESPKWSLDEGLIVKRTANPKEGTLEAWGIVDGQPTSKHYSICVYDDTVVKDSVTTPEMIEKTTYSWSVSLALGSDQPDKPCRRRYIGTRWHMRDTYHEIMAREAAIPRIFYPTDLGKDDIDAVGKPVLLTTEQLLDKRKHYGPYSYASQMLNNPSADRAMGFQESWLRFYNVLRNHLEWNYFLLVDPASAKKKYSDYTAMVVIALAPDNNYYLIDAIRDRLNLTQRCDKVFEFMRKWPIKKVGYEQYGMQADIEHIRYVQEQEGYRFPIEPLGGGMVKEDRIRRMVPIFEGGRFYMPQRLLYTTAEGKLVDFVATFINEEYLDFPVSNHDDCFDIISRIVEDNLGASFPKLQPSKMPSMTQNPEAKGYDILKGNTQGAKVLG